VDLEEKDDGNEEHITSTAGPGRRNRLVVSDDEDE